MKINYPIPIRAKLVIIVLVFAIVPMLVLTMVWYNTSVERVAAVARLGLETRAQEIVSQLQALKQKNPAFREILSRVDDTAHHPNREYFVLKNILVNTQEFLTVDVKLELGQTICHVRAVHHHQLAGDSGKIAFADTQAHIAALKITRAKICTARCWVANINFSGAHFIR